MSKSTKASALANQEIPIQTTMLSQMILNMLMAIQGSEQAFSELARKTREFRRMDKQAKTDTAERVAENVVRFVEESKPLSYQRIGLSKIKRKIIEELRSK